jgi:hypothetical protein
MTDSLAPAPHHVRRDELLDWRTYADGRDAIRAEVMAIKAARRIHLGDNLTFLFENHDTMRYQVQEIMRVEQIVRESGIREELDTYNGMLGGPGQLGCALLIEIEDEAKRRPLLEAWLGLQECLYAETADGSRTYAEFDPTQVGRGRLSAVQYLSFSLESGPLRLGSDFATLELTVDLTEDQRAALAADLAATHS